MRSLIQKSRATSETGLPVARTMRTGLAFTLLGEPHTSSAANNVVVPLRT
jgi:hypothetical protein